MQARDRTLDLIRGAAASAVVIYHLPLIADEGPLLVPWLFGWTSQFGFGVSAFFVLSAYLLTIIMPRYQRHRNPMAAYAIKRFFRIAPLFYASFLAWAAYWLSQNQTPFPPADTIVASVSLLFNLVPTHAHGGVFAGWTIGVEVLFYLLFPVLFVTIRTTSGAASAIIAACALAMSFAVLLPRFLDEQMAADYRIISLPGHLPTFLFGMLLGRLHNDNGGLGKFRSWAPILYASSLLLFTATYLDYAPLHQGSVLAVSAALFVAACICMPPQIAARPIAFLGKISFSIYLMHGPIIKALGGVFARVYTLPIPVEVAFVCSNLLAFVAIVTVSYCTFRLIEVPGMQFGDFLIAKMDNPKGRVPDPF